MTLWEILNYLKSILQESFLIDIDVRNKYSSKKLIIADHPYFSLFFISFLQHSCIFIFCWVLFLIFSLILLQSDLAINILINLIMRVEIFVQYWLKLHLEFYGDLSIFLYYRSLLKISMEIWRYLISIIMFILSISSVPTSDTTNIPSSAIRACRMFFASWWSPD